MACKHGMYGMAKNGMVMHGKQRSKIRSEGQCCYGTNYIAQGVQPHTARGPDVSMRTHSAAFVKAITFNNLTLHNVNVMPFPPKLLQIVINHYLINSYFSLVRQTFVLL